MIKRRTRGEGKWHARAESGRVDSSRLYHRKADRRLKAIL